MKNTLKNFKKNEKGFTLIELIVVIAIIGILAAVLLPKFTGFTDNARKNSAMSEAKNVYTAYVSCQSESGTVTADEIKKYLGKLPQGTSALTIATTDPIIKYETVISGKTYAVEIKDGGEITVTPKS